MSTRARRSPLERARTKTRSERDESGSLILDILIGMAIFALIAIIAVSAVGQYRMRAYTQAAMSDAEALALAIQATVTDNAGKADAAIPTGPLSAEDVDSLGVAVTTTGPEASDVTVIPSPADPEAFTVCVEHRGAYAEYESEKGLTVSGDAAKDGYAGCLAQLPPPEPGAYAAGTGAVPCPQVDSVSLKVKDFYQAGMWHKNYKIVTKAPSVQSDQYLFATAQQADGTWRYFNSNYTLSDRATGTFEAFDAFRGNFDGYPDPFVVVPQVLGPNDTKSQGCTVGWQISHADANISGRPEGTTIALTKVTVAPQNW